MRMRPTGSADPGHPDAERGQRPEVVLESLPGEEQVIPGRRIPADRFSDDELGRTDPDVHKVVGHKGAMIYQ